MTTAKRKPKVTAESQLRGVLMVLDQKTKTPPAEVLVTIRAMVQDALEVLQERDPLKQRVAFVLLAVQQSTQVAVRLVRGKEMTRVTIVDQNLYHWALREIHALAGAA